MTDLTRKKFLSHNFSVRDKTEPWDPENNLEHFSSTLQVRGDDDTRRYVVDGDVLRGRYREDVQYLYRGINND